MLGAILGDIAGSRFEFNNNRKVPEKLFTNDCFATDDSYLTCAVADALFHYKKYGYDLESAVVYYTLDMFRAFPRAGWGLGFSRWAHNSLSTFNEKDYRNGRKVMYDSNPSAGNGCAMKISPVPYFADSMEECKELTRRITSVTHDHEDSYKAAECLTTSMYMALEGKTRDQIRQNILSYYPEVAKMTYEGLRKDYIYTELAKDTVPQAMVCFLESKSFEEALEKAISIGGDADTLGAIAGALAEAFYKWKGDKYDEYFEMIGDYGQYLVPWKSVCRFAAIYHKKNSSFYGSSRP